MKTIKKAAEYFGRGIYKRGSGSERVTIARVALLAVLLGLALVKPDILMSRPLDPAGYEKLGDGLLVKTRSGGLKIEIVADDVIRVTSAADGIIERESLVVLPLKHAGVHWDVEERDGSALIKTRLLTVKVDLDSGALVFEDRDGSVLLAEGKRTIKPVRIMGEMSYKVSQAFHFQKGEALYGLGQFQGGRMNWRGEKVPLVQANKTSVNPFLVSTKGYGVLWDNYSKTVFEDSKAGPDGASEGSFRSEAGEGLDYYFIYGPEMDRVISAYRGLTGHAPMYPKWAYGYFQSKNRYQSWDEIIEVIREYRDRGVPLDAVVLDYKYWGDLGWSAFLFDEEAGFGNPEERIREIHDMNARLMISIWPKVGKETPVGRELVEKGLDLDPALIRATPNAVMHDAYDEAAREVYWRHARAGIFDRGVDALWMDGTEPEFITTGTRLETELTIKLARSCALGPISKYLNTYSLMDTMNVYRSWRDTKEEKRVFILTRSAFAGQQRYAASTWSGDITATWEVFKKQIPAGLNFCMAGIPYWTTDIGGYWLSPRDLLHGQGKITPAYRELYVRWFQYGAFCPIFRSHGQHVPREVWRFGEPGDPSYDALVDSDNLRYRLMPYIYSVAWMVTNEGYTMMRALAMDFRRDPKAYDIGDQFMFGPAILVSPVTEPMKNKGSSRRAVYLPESAGWYDFWTGKRSDGGQRVEARSTLSTIPLFVRAGSIIPMGPYIQYAEEETDPIEVRVYPGADASFTLYEDENDNYNYEKGAYSTIEFSWNNSENVLTIWPRRGDFPGMKEERRVNVVMVRPGSGAGVEPEKFPDLSVTYKGSPLRLEF